LPYDLPYLQRHLFGRFDVDFYNDPICNMISIFFGFRKSKNIFKIQGGTADRRPQALRPRLPLFLTALKGERQRSLRLNLGGGVCVMSGIAE
jgi:hypothetical protein